MSETITDVYRNEREQLVVSYRMAYGSDEYTYWVPAEDEGFIAEHIEVGKSYDITMEKHRTTRSGKPRYRWVHIEPR